MSTRSTYDGARLEEVLERVHRELGPDATILAADKCRRGGIGGFFAKEWYEVTVESPDGDGGIEPAVGSDPLDALMSLAESVTDERQVSSTPGRADGPRPMVRVDADGLIAAPTPTGEFAAALAAAHRTVALPGALPGPAPEPSSVAAGSIAAAGSVATAARLPTPVESSADAPSIETPVAGPSSALVPAPHTRRLRDLDLADLLGHLDRLAPARPLPTGATVVAVVGELASARGAASALAVRLGLDAEDVVVASPVPREGISPWLAVDGPAAAASRARRWRQADHPTVVAVDLAPGAEGLTWAAEVVGRLGADQVRLVAKAWQLADQLVPKADALGGIDGLELVEVDASAEPELFLELTMPVLSIDGRSATSELWAALLMERRTDDDR